MFDLVEPHENAILDRNTITLPAYTETTAVPTSIDTTQDGVIVLLPRFSPATSSISTSLPRPRS